MLNASAILQPGIEWKELSREESSRMWDWCFRAGLCHRALERGGGAQSFLLCCSAKTELVSRDGGS